MNETIMLVIAALTYIGALVGIYVSMRVKLKELDVKLFNIEKDLEAYKVKNDETSERINTLNRHDHADIIIKLDQMMEKIYNIKIENAKTNTRNRKDI